MSRSVVRWFRMQRKVSTMKNPIFVISDDHSYLGVYRTPEDAQSYLATRVADDRALQQKELHFYDGLGHRIDAERSDVATFALRGASTPAEPEDLRRRIDEALRVLREWLESQPELVRNRRGEEFRKAEVLDRLSALEEKVGPDVPFDELIPAVIKEFGKDDDAEQKDLNDDAAPKGLKGGAEPKGLKLCSVTCSCCG
jgi:hypothetical protein